MTDAKKFMGEMQGMKDVDTSKIEVDEEQTPPAVEAGSAEEEALLEKMEDLVKESGDAEAMAADKGTKLMCLRGRKYEPARGAEVLYAMLALKKEAAIGTPADDVLTEDIKSNKIMNIGSRDRDGRAVLWIRLRFHNPKRSAAPNMVRFVTTVMLSALRDAETQRKGITVVQDMSGLKLSNLDPATAKALFGKIFPALPIRVGRIVIFNPPWILGHVILPFVFNFLSKKLRNRIKVINGFKPEALAEFVDQSSLPAELSGTFALDEAKWAEALLADLPK